MAATSSLVKGLGPVIRRIINGAVPDQTVASSLADNIETRLGAGHAPDQILSGNLAPELRAVEPELRAVMGKDFLREGQPYTKRADTNLLSIENPLVGSPVTPPAPPSRGSADELFPEVFKKIRESAAPAHEREMMRNSALEMLGYRAPESAADRAMARFGDAAAGFEVATKLGLGAVSQLSQFLTGATRTQLSGSMKNLYRSLNDPEAMAFALDSGATLGSVVRDAEAMLTGGGNQTQKFLNITQFTRMDMAARTFSALQGSAMAEFQANQLYKAFTKWGGQGVAPASVKKIEGRLLNLGIDPRDVIEQGGRLTREQKLYAANTAAFDVNFWGDSLALPAFWRSPWGKVIFQFKSFGYQQTKMIKSHVIDPWVKYGDYGPALRFAMLVPLGGEVIADIKAFLRGRKRTDNMSMRLLENLAQAGSFGLAADAFFQSQRGFAGAASLVVGPTVSDGLTIAEAASEVFEGDPKKAAEAAIRMAPGVASSRIPGSAVPAAILGATVPAAANTLFPSGPEESDRRREQRTRREDAR